MNDNNVCICNDLLFPSFCCDDINPNMLSLLFFNLCDSAAPVFHTASENQSYLLLFKSNVLPILNPSWEIEAANLWGD